jgi:UDP-N-acetylmuramate: L-alanyl-gamma-D-glutamyl-meso-diaminopimelate ligase
MLGADCAEAMRLRSQARCPVETFGLDADADWRATNVRPDGERMRFDVTRYGDRLGSVVVPLYGRHNVRNALAALTAGAAAGLSFEEMVDGFARFEGVRRRLETRGTVRGVRVIDDFAHHPTAILETLRAVRWSFPERRIWAVFEPRSATSCRRIFQDEFVRAFEEGGADETILASVFRTSLAEDERLSVDTVIRRLRAAGRRARHVATTGEIVATIAGEAKDGDVVVIMSNGAFDNIHQRLLEALRQAEPAS